MFQRFLLTAAALAAAALPAATSAATGFYTYTGQNFTTVVAGNCLTTSMHLVVSITLPRQLAPNLGWTSIAPSSIDVTVGPVHFRKSPRTSIPFFDVTTDATGQIDHWQFDIRKTDASSTLLYEVMSSKAGDGVFATGNDQAFTLRCRPTGATATNAQLFGAWSSP